MKGDLKTMDGYDQQSAALATGKGFSGWVSDFFGPGKGGASGAGAADKKADAPAKGGADKKAGSGSVLNPLGPWPWLGAASKQGPGGEVGPVQGGAESKDAAGTTVAAADGAQAKEAGGLPPGLPNDFGSEVALKAWIGEFNRSLAGMKAAARKKYVDRLKARTWGDESGMKYELLAAAAAKEPTPSGPGKTSADATPASGEALTMPGPALNARILAMLSRDNGALLGGIQGYQGKCLQFSAKLMEDLGAKRADGTGAMKDKAKTTQKGPLTARFRGKRLKEIPKELPAGYQICVVSRPEWGFTEVGNHWFISAGAGYYLDDVMGVTNAAQMEASLLKTTADQWAQRVVGKNEDNPRRVAMGTAFAKAHPSVKQYQGLGRSAHEGKKTLANGQANPEFKEPAAAEKSGTDAVKAIVDAQRDVYVPRVWVVEPTKKTDGA